MYADCKGENHLKPSAFRLSTKTVVTIGIGAALYGATSFISIPIGPDTSLRPAIALLTVFGAFFGPLVGFLAGLIGHVINDLLNGGIVWWGWALGSGITAAFMGLIYLHKNFDPQRGAATRKHLGYLLIYGIVGIFVSLIFSWWFDVTFMGEPGNKVWVQVGMAASANIAVFIILGLPAVFGFAKRNAKNGSLKLDE